MSLPICPIQDVCSKYHNGTKNKSHHMRLIHVCTEFLKACCEMGIQLEFFLSDEPIACNLEKIHKAKGESTVELYPKDKYL